MSTRIVSTPTSRLRLGLARAEVTPPVGIYHRMWGAARHDRATGIHRLLFGDVVALGAPDGHGVDFLRIYLDGVGLAEGQDRALRDHLAEVSDVPAERVAILYSHTHAGGLFWPDRQVLPGGELIEPYLAQLATKLGAATREAVSDIQPVVVSYATGHCNMAANRDHWDAAFGGYTCGYNPDAPADDTVLVARIANAAGQTIGTIVNYACHPTTLAWENTKISSDFVGALREEIERATGGLCVFAQGACGDLGPRYGYVGDTAVADQNGRQLAYAALSALSTLGPPNSDFAYRGPVISGATLGDWRPAPQSAERVAASRRFGGGSFLVDLPLKAIPNRATLEQQKAEWEEKQREADARGDQNAARDFGARAERARRWIGNLDSLPTGSTFPFPYSVLRLGDATWVTCGGEPYNLLQTALRQRFPNQTLLVSPLDGGGAAAYLLPRERYGKGLYQEEPSVLAPGCLEMLIDAIAARIEAF